MRKAINHLRAADPVIAGIMERYGPYRIKYLDPVFSTLAKSIVYQQLSGKAALTIYTRLEDAAGRGGITPASVLRLGKERLRPLGLSNQKASYLVDLAEKTKRREVRFELLALMADEDVIRHLVAVKGVGLWTAHMFLIFALRRPDILPTGDLGIRTAIQRAYDLDTLPAPEKMEEIARPWRPYASVASWYLWRSLENRAAL